MGETEKNLEALLKESKEADVVLFLDEVRFVIIIRCVHHTGQAEVTKSGRPYATPSPTPRTPDHNLLGCAFCHPPFLLIHQAESLLRRRTEASANYETRWSNLLLQRIETYEGVLIAATNLQEIVDEAYQVLQLQHARTTCCLPHTHIHTSSPPNCPPSDPPGLPSHPRSVVSSSG